MGKGEIIRNCVLGISLTGLFIMFVIGLYLLLVPSEPYFVYVITTYKENNQCFVIVERDDNGEEECLWCNEEQCNNFALDTVYKITTKGFRSRTTYKRINTMIPYSTPNEGDELYD